MKQYFDADGNPCELGVLCKREPAWAANVIRELSRRDWDVRVLDAWASLRDKYTEDSRLWSSEKWHHEWCCEWGHVPKRDCYERIDERWGASREESRARAAEAVWVELPESVRAEIGERP